MGHTVWQISRPVIPVKALLICYSRQLHAYAYALEHPATNAFALAPITNLGLLYFYPDNINQQSVDRLNYGAEIVWVETEKDEHGFLKFIDEVLSAWATRSPRALT